METEAMKVKRSDERRWGWTKIGGGEGFSLDVGRSTLSHQSRTKEPDHSIGDRGGERGAWCSFPRTLRCPYHFLCPPSGHRVLVTVVHAALLFHYLLIHFAIRRRERALTWPTHAHPSSRIGHESTPISSHFSSFRPFVAVPPTKTRRTSLGTISPFFSPLNFAKVMESGREFDRLLLFDL